MHCPKCGIKMLDDEYFCSSCGYLSEIAAAAHLAEIQSEIPEVQPREIPYYAGFWRRLSALFLDLIFLVLAEAFLLLVFGGGIILVASVGKRIIPFPIIQSFFGGFGIMMLLIANWFYFVFMESSSRQATLGKQIMQIIVTDVREKRITSSKANLRYWSKIISAIPLFFGFIMGSYTPRKQALHDKIAKTLVLNKNRDR